MGNNMSFFTIILLCDICVISGYLLGLYYEGKEKEIYKNRLIGLEKKCTNYSLRRFNNYVDTRTDKERLRDESVQITTTTTAHKNREIVYVKIDDNVNHFPNVTKKVEL